MPNNPLFYAAQPQPQAPSFQDQIQIALAIADDATLKSLLANCIPAIASPHLIGEIFSEIGVPVTEQRAADGVIHYEAVKCALAHSLDEVERRLSEHGPIGRDRPDAWMPIKCESGTCNVGQGLSLAEAEALLANVGFNPQQTRDILQLPYEASYKSWWYGLDAEENLTIPFRRLIRTLRYPDGTFTIQYKDQFGQEKPPCFSGLPQKVLIAIKPDDQRFAETLRNINACRESMKLTQAILICNTISELEAQAFIQQGISIYPAVDLILPMHANCEICATSDCPLNGTVDSPVAICYRFGVEATYI